MPSRYTKIPNTQARTQTAASADAKRSYTHLHSRFCWDVPEFFNMAQVCSQRWAAQPDAARRVAIRSYTPQADGAWSETHHSYAQLQTQANQLANVLHGLGVRAGDRVAIVMPQRFETAVAFMAVLQMGAVAMPLSMLFGPEALEFRLRDSEAVLAIVDAQALADVQAVRSTCPALRTVMRVGVTSGVVDGDEDLGDVQYAAAVVNAAAQFAAVSTRAQDPAVLIYTSGTTGNPKGALIPHQALLGNLSGFVCSQNWFGFDPFPDAAARALPPHLRTPHTPSVFWSPADWAWTGGLMDALLPTLYFGRSIVAYAGRFGAQTALDLMGRCGVTHTFLFPTAIKAMMKAFPGHAGRPVRAQFGLQLQAIMSAGEAMGDAVFGYCEAQLGVTPNEMFGQTEINYIVGNCALHWPPKPGSMGKAYPGHRVAVIDEQGRECPVGVPGDVALHRRDVHGVPDPIFFLGYWKNPGATQDKFTGGAGPDDWCRTGDLAVRDADGYLWYQGRSDDVFKSAGYRIGPGEIENCLVKHPAVANAAVVPKPDSERGALVKAYVVIAPDVAAPCAGNAAATAELHAQLTQQLQAHVKDLLAPYEYPKEIEFVEALPMTTTGKVQRRVLRLQEEARARQV